MRKILAAIAGSAAFAGLAFGQTLGPEVKRFVEVNAPAVAVCIATEHGAQYLGEADRIGTIAPGKYADVVVIKGDPSRKIEDIENVEIVFKDGVGYNSAKLIESVRGQVGMQ